MAQGGRSIVKAAAETAAVGWTSHPVAVLGFSNLIGSALLLPLALVDGLIIVSISPRSDFVVGDPVAARTAANRASVVSGVLQAIAAFGAGAASAAIGNRLSATQVDADVVWKVRAGLTAVLGAAGFGALAAGGRVRSAAIEGASVVTSVAGLYVGYHYGNAVADVILSHVWPGFADRVKC